MQATSRPPRIADQTQYSSPSTRSWATQRLAGEAGRAAAVSAPGAMIVFEPKRENSGFRTSLEGARGTRRASAAEARVQVAGASTPASRASAGKAALECRFRSDRVEGANSRSDQ